MCFTHTHDIPAGQPGRAPLSEVRGLKSLQVCWQRLGWRCPAAMPLSLQLWLSMASIPGHPFGTGARGGALGWRPSTAAKRDSKELGCATFSSGNNMTDGADSDPWSFAESRTSGRFSAFQLLLQRVSISKPQFLELKKKKSIYLYIYLYLLVCILLALGVLQDCDWPFPTTTTGFELCCLLQ